MPKSDAELHIDVYDPDAAVPDEEFVNRVLERDISASFRRVGQLPCQLGKHYYTALHAVGECNEHWPIKGT